MFSEAPILIAEKNLYLALDLSSAVEEMAGRVVGPASTVEEALALLIRLLLLTGIRCVHHQASTRLTGG